MKLRGGDQGALRCSTRALEKNKKKSDTYRHVIQLEGNELSITQGHLMGFFINNNIQICSLFFLFSRPCGKVYKDDGSAGAFKSINLTGSNREWFLPG
jgi:hypothetical protein